MRISTAALHQQGIANILRNQAALAKTQNELALGVRITTAKDDPGAWARASGLDQYLAQLERFRSNSTLAQNHLGLEENALSSATDTLNRVRELALQANSGTQSADARASIAQEMRARIGDLLATANSSDGEGRYVFAGSADASAPFSLAAVGVNYSGNGSTRLVDVGPERSVALGDSGDQVFQNLLSGNGTFAVSAAATNTGSVKLDSAAIFNAAAWDGDSYTLSFTAGNYEIRDSASNVVATAAYQDGNGIRFRGVDLTLSGTPVDGDRFSIAPSQSQDMFATLQKIAALVANTPADPASRAQQQTEFFGALQELDSAMTRVNDVHATVGHRLNAIDDSSAQMDAIDVQSKTALSGIRDLDYAEATGRLNLQMTALQAAQQSYVRIQGLSLFDFLR